MISAVRGIIVMGPMGCGKSTVGSLLAARLQWQFIEGDEYHLPKSIEKMRAGIPLGDPDRFPWLDTLAGLIEQLTATGGGVVLACSALKTAYRLRLGIDQQRIVSVYLKGDRDLLQRRLQNRNHHYMQEGLLTSQLATLEEPREGLIVDIVREPLHIVEHIIRQLNL